MIGIVAHPDRRNLVGRIAPICKPDVIVWDSDGSGCEANHLRLLNYMVDATNPLPPDPWAVVLEDDVILNDDFLDQMRMVLHFAPTPVVSFYLGRNFPHGGKYDWQNRIAARISQDVSFYTAESLLSAQGYAVSFTYLADIVAAIPPNLPIDEAISVACQSKGILVSHCRPSIVDHLDGPPIITERPDGQPRDKERKAWLFGGKPQWDSTTAHLDAVR